MKKLIPFLCAFVFIFSSCSEKSQLTGTVKDPNFEGKKIVLLTFKDYDSPFEPTDSTTIQNGKFHFDIKNTDEPSIGYVVIKGEGSTEPLGGGSFVNEKGNIEMEIDTISKVKGTPLNDKSQVLFDKLLTFTKKNTTLVTKIETTSDTALAEKYILEQKELQKNLSVDASAFIKENIKNKVGEYYLISLAGLLDPDLIKNLVSETSPEFQKMMNGSSDIDSDKKKFVGKQYIDLTGKSPNNKNISLSDYVGKNKVVLVDFWASWCGPCRKEMPIVAKAYQQFKDKGFEIVGISLDDDKNAWEDGIKKFNITWPQMSDLKGWESDLAAVYDVKFIPYTLLIDQQGKIIEEGINAEDLIEKLNVLLN